MKSTRTALLLSFCSIVLCVVMLVGTTFAWFTDTASAAVSMVQSGTLDIVLEYATDWDSSGNPTVWADTANLQGSLQFRKAAEAGGEPVLWEPGCTYSLPELRIRNSGSLALKYKVKITGIDGDDAFSRSINWNIRNSADGNNPTSLDEKEYHLTAKTSETAPAHILTISGTMLDNAGKDCQGKKLNGIRIAIVATQDTVEYDSNGNTYDEQAVYPVHSAASMKEALDEINSSDTVHSGILALNQDFEYANEELSVASGKNITIDLAGNDLTVRNANTDGLTINGGTLTLSNSGTTGTYTFDCTASGSDSIYLTNTEAETAATLNIDGNVEIKVAANANSAIHAYAPAGKAEVNINNGTVTISGTEQTSAIVVDQNATLNMKGGLLNIQSDFDSYSDGNDVVGILVWGQIGLQENIAVNVSGGTIRVGGRNAFAQAIQIGMKNGYSQNCAVNVTGGTFDIAPTENGKGYAFTTYKNVYGKFTMSAGAVTGRATALALAYIGKTDLTVTGGTFCVDPTDYLGAGHSAVCANGIWTVN